MILSRESFVNLIFMMLPRSISQEVRCYIASQFALESDFGRSSFASFFNNYCGMKVPSIRLTTASNFDKKGTFAKFDSLGSCITDYLLYLQALKFNKFELNSVVAFRLKLDLVGYCPDLGYLDKIDSIYRQYFDSTFNP